jgi:hypothetical protein
MKIRIVAKVPVLIYKSKQGFERFRKKLSLWLQQRLLKKQIEMYSQNKILLIL